MCSKIILIPESLIGEKMMRGSPQQIEPSLQQRQLAAIVIPDIIGYPKTIAANAQHAIQPLKRKRKIIYPPEETFGGEKNPQLFT